MTTRTIQDSLNNANPNVIANRLSEVSIGDVIAGLIPRAVVRSGLSSSATQVESAAGAILAVASSADAALLIVHGTVTPGAGEVAITYDDNGVATLVFNAAVTGYKATMLALPADLGDILATAVGGV